LKRENKRERTRKVRGKTRGRERKVRKRERKTRERMERKVRSISVLSGCPGGEALECVSFSIIRLIVCAILRLGNTN
jgi:hypothetical protein